ncbi:MAG: glycosyltransferase family 4 protein [Gemmatimonadales bacterium]
MTAARSLTGCWTPCTGKPPSPGEATRSGARILVVNWQDRLNPQAGGAEIHLHEIFGRLAERGHDVTLLVSGWRGAPTAERLDGMEVLRTGSRYTFPLHARRAFRRANGKRFDLLVEDVNKSPLFTPRWSDTPVAVLVPHLFGSTAFREAWAPVACAVWMAERRMLPAYQRVPIQAISRSTKEDLVGRGFAADRIRVVYPGVDHRVYRPEPGVARFQQPTFAYVGRLKRYKGLDVVLSAAAELDRSGWSGRILIAGTGDDERRLRRLARGMDLEQTVEFLGFVAEQRKVELLRRAWAVLYPSPKEGWGLTNVEAAACGTAAIASDSPGLRESVVDGKSGYLVHHEEAGAWVARLRELSDSPELRDRLGRGALEHAAGYSWDRAADETEAWLDAALSGHGGRG